MTYQDRIDGGGTVMAEGYRSCADRYEVVRKVAQGLRRPFTVLDLGASSGYFSIRLTQEFGARAVAVDKDSSVREAIGRVAAVEHKAVTPEIVRRLGTYDMVLALSFLHHVPNWPVMLDMLCRVARSALIVETPNSGEKLRVAHNRRELGRIDRAVRQRGLSLVGYSSGVWDNDLRRGIYLLRREGLPTCGTIFSGSGNNGLHTQRFREELGKVLGYSPFPGSLNLRTQRAFRLGAYAAEYVDEKRGRGGRKGGDYQVWHARVEGFDGPAHAMRPGVRSHGRNVLEVWAPVKLKDYLDLKDGDTVNLRIGA